MGINKQKNISGMNHFYSEATAQRIAALQKLINIVIQPHTGIYAQRHHNMEINRQKNTSVMNHFSIETTLQRTVSGMNHFYNETALQRNKFKFI
jgi:hypothetical protein